MEYSTLIKTIRKKLITFSKSHGFEKLKSNYYSRDTVDAVQLFVIDYSPRIHHFYFEVSLEEPPLDLNEASITLARYWQGAAMPKSFLMTFSRAMSCDIEQDLEQRLRIIDEGLSDYVAPWIRRWDSKEKVHLHLQETEIWTKKDFFTPPGGLAKMGFEWREFAG